MTTTKKRKLQKESTREKKRKGKKRSRGVMGIYIDMVIARYPGQPA